MFGHGHHWSRRWLPSLTSDLPCHRGTAWQSQDYVWLWLLLLDLIQTLPSWLNLGLASSAWTWLMSWTFGWTLVPSLDLPHFGVLWSRILAREVLVLLAGLSLLDPGSLHLREQLAIAAPQQRHFIARAVAWQLSATTWNSTNALQRLPNPHKVVSNFSVVEMWLNQQPCWTAHSTKVLRPPIPPQRKPHLWGERERDFYKWRKQKLSCATGEQWKQNCGTSWRGAYIQMSNWNFPCEVLTSIDL